MSDTDFEYGFGKDSEQAEVCTGTVECTACKKFHGWCDEVSKKLKGENMLPAPSSQNSSSQGRSTGKNSNRLQVADLSMDPVSAKILAVQVAEKQAKWGGGTQVVIKMAIKGAIKFWYLDVAKNPNYQILVNKLGQDENEWPDTEILMGLEKDDFHEVYYPRVTFPAATASQSKRK